LKELCGMVEMFLPKEETWSSKMVTCDLKTRSKVIDKKSCCHASQPINYENRYLLKYCNPESEFDDPRWPIVTLKVGHGHWWSLADETMFRSITL
jgi:hypothetical protein